MTLVCLSFSLYVVLISFMYPNGSNALALILAFKSVGNHSLILNSNGQRKSLHWLKTLFCLSKLSDNPAGVNICSFNSTLPSIKNQSMDYSSDQISLHSKDK